MEDRAKIFIASSQSALNLALALKLWFPKDSTVAIPWNEFKGGAQAVADKLMQAAREDFDFAVIILTQDDFVLEKDKEKRMPRDNCIFEAGLFMGTLGFKRCFLVSSVEHENVPSDMQNLDRFNIVQPSNLDYETCKKAIDEAPDLDNILQSIKGQGKRQRTYQYNFVSMDDLLRLENDLQKGWVVVSADQPTEYSYEVLKNVAANIHRGVKYKYFFHASGLNAESICLLLQMILIANYLEDQEKAEDIRYQQKVAREKIPVIKNDLKEIIQLDLLKIYLLPHEPPFHFALHMGKTESEQKVLLRITGIPGFLQFETGREATSCFDKLKKLVAEEENRVFVYTTKYCKFEKSEEINFKSEVLKRIKELFPQDPQDIFDLCWGEKG